MDCFPVPHLLAELAQANGGGHEECAFLSSAQAALQEIPHPPFSPGSLPEAFCSRLVSSKGGCDCGACEGFL